MKLLVIVMNCKHDGMVAVLFVVTCISWERLILTAIKYVGKIWRFLYLSASAHIFQEQKSEMQV